MSGLGWRQLPDGSWLNDFTGDLKGINVEAENNGRRMAERAGLRRPVLSPGPHPPTPTQNMVQLPQVKPGQAPRELINPNPNLALNPYELGMGDDPSAAPAVAAPVPLSDNSKRTMMFVGIIGLAAGAVWLGNKMQTKKQKK